MGPQHAYALAARLEQVADHPLTLNQGTLYPALVRLEQKGWITGTWQKTENNRDAKYYAVANPGECALVKEAERWRRLAGLGREDGQSICETLTATVRASGMRFTCSFLDPEDPVLYRRELASLQIVASTLTPDKGLRVAFEPGSPPHACVTRERWHGC